MGFTHDCYGMVLLTHKHIGTQTVRFYFSLKGSMEGLNNCVYYVHVLETMNSHYSSMHGLSRGQSFQGPSSRTQNPKPMGSHSLINNLTHWLKPLFWPLTSAKNPCFYQKLSPKLPLSSTLSKFWKFFTQRPQIEWNLRKMYRKCPLFLWLFVNERPPIPLPCMCFRGILLRQTRSEAGKFCICETESCNLVNTFLVQI